MFHDEELINLIDLLKKFPELKMGEIKIGIDVDGTVTNERFAFGTFGSVLNAEQMEREYAKCTLKKGAEILEDLSKIVPIYYYFITGRRERYRKVTDEMFSRFRVAYKELAMVPTNFYDEGYSVQKYIEFKVDAFKKRGIVLGLDDNEEVVKALNENDINAFKVESDFRHAFKGMLLSYGRKN